MQMLCAPESDTLHFGEIVRWAPNVICVRMEESAGAMFRVGSDVELRVYREHHAEVLQVRVIVIEDVLVWLRRDSSDDEKPAYRVEPRQTAEESKKRWIGGW